MSDENDNQQGQSRLLWAKVVLSTLVLACGITLLILGELLSGMAFTAMGMIGGTTIFALRREK